MQWWIVGVAYFGLTLASGTSLIPGSLYVNLFLIALVEVPGYYLGI